MADLEVRCTPASILSCKSVNLPKSWCRLLRKRMNVCSVVFPPIFAAQIAVMIREKILVIGASGQIGVELTLALRKIYGNQNVIASDLREQNPLLEGTGPYVSLDVMNKEMLHVQVIRQNITQIYLLAAILSATGEKNPNLAWNLNMTGLLNVLDIAREEKLHKVY